MVPLKTFRDLQQLRKLGALTAMVLEEVAGHVRPGVTTQHLDDIVVDAVGRHGVKAAFKGYRGYPGHICISVNNEIVHGIPQEGRILADGDIVSLDLGIYANGFYSDMAVTVPVGQVSSEDEQLMRVTEEALYKGIEQARLGNRLHDISAAVQQHVEGNGYSVVKAFVGHGIGRNLHEDPQIPNYGRAGTGVKLKEGMVLAIEPMVNAGTDEAVLMGDGWTAVTKDGRRSAHFEHCVAITREGPLILTKQES